jgi:hypothetical protein
VLCSRKKYLSKKNYYIIFKVPQGERVYLFCIMHMKVHAFIFARKHSANCYYMLITLMKLEKWKLLLCLWRQMTFATPLTLCKWGFPNRAELQCLLGKWWCGGWVVGLMGRLVHCSTTLPLVSFFPFSSPYLGYPHLLVSFGLGQTHGHIWWQLDIF